MKHGDHENAGFKQLKEAIGIAAERHVTSLWDEFAEHVDTPIERLFLTTLIAGLWFGNRDGWSVSRDAKVSAAARERGVGFVVQTQAQVSDFRVDFLVSYKVRKDNEAIYESLIVECDGHDFHERTKEQATRDKSRDFRFTGTEIFTHPDCALEILAHIRKANRGRWS